ncbi:MAG TPA: hypothetical protein VF519_05885 [Mycobacteriales bacterium]
MSTIVSGTLVTGRPSTTPNARRGHVRARTTCTPRRSGSAALEGTTRSTRAGSATPNPWRYAAASLATATRRRSPSRRAACRTASRAAEHRVANVGGVPPATYTSGCASTHTPSAT